MISTLVVLIYSLSCVCHKNVPSLHTEGTNVKTICVIVTLHECFGCFMYIRLPTM